MNFPKKGLFTTSVYFSFVFGIDTKQRLEKYLLRRTAMQNLLINRPLCHKQCHLAIIYISAFNCEVATEYLKVVCTSELGIRGPSWGLYDL